VTKMLIGPHLTRGYDALTDEQARRTFAGMAHLAGTGPTGATCRTCVHWATRFWSGGDRTDARVTDFKREVGGQLRNRCCKKFFRMMQSTLGRAIPHSAAACRHYQENVGAPPIERPVKEKKAKTAAKS
jgi:hypothetical protein